jgi:hypothetical protein
LTLTWWCEWVGIQYILLGDVLPASGSCLFWLGHRQWCVKLLHGHVRNFSETYTIFESAVNNTSTTPRQIAFKFGKNGIYESGPWQFLAGADFELVAKRGHRALYRLIIRSKEVQYVSPWHLHWHRHLPLLRAQQYNYVPAIIKRSTVSERCRSMVTCPYSRAMQKVLKYII